MCSHNWHRSWIHFDNALSDSVIPALVFPSARFWSSTFMLNAKSAGPVTSWMSFAVVIWIVKPHTTASYARARVDQLSRSQSRTIRILEGTPTKMSHYRIIYFFSLLIIKITVFSEKKPQNSKIFERKIHVFFVVIVI